MTNKPLIEEIRARLSSEIKNSGKTQIEIAKELGITQQMISCYVHSKKVPTIDTLSRLCKFLDIDANYILCIDD